MVSQSVVDQINQKYNLFNHDNAQIFLTKLNNTTDLSDDELIKVSQFISLNSTKKNQKF